jgi:hypothetical protein
MPPPPSLPCQVGFLRPWCLPQSRHRTHCPRTWFGLIGVVTVISGRRWSEEARKQEVGEVVSRGDRGG